MQRFSNQEESSETPFCDNRYGDVKLECGEFPRRLEFQDALELVMDTEKQLSQWVQRALDHAQIKQADLARALVQSGLATIDRSAVNKIVLGTRKVSGEEMLEISRITGYPIPDRRIGAKSKAAEPKPAEKVVEAPPTEPPDNKDVNAQREIRLRTLVSTVLEAQGMTAAMAERLASAIARVADMPPDPRSGTSDPNQIRVEARLLAAIFDPKHPL